MKNFKDIKKRAEIFTLLIVITSFLIISFINRGVATSLTSGSLSSLRVWDDTDSEGGSLNKLTYKTYASYSECWNKAESVYNAHFFANYTNLTSGQQVSDGSCNLRSNETGSYTGWKAMAYNSSSALFEYNKSFTYKGALGWQINCTHNNYNTLELSDSITINNTGPCVFNRENGDPNGQLPSQACYEDASCSFNFASSVGDDDANDVLAYSYTNGFTGFSMNSGGGVTISVTTDSGTGTFNVSLKVTDSSSLTTSATKIFNVLPVNDAPEFLNLQDISVNMSTLYRLLVQARDEENNVPFAFSINFTSCSLAPWSTRSNCTLFNLTYYNSTATNVTFNGTKNDVGSYIITFSVSDTNSLTQPYNATRSQIVNFTILNINGAPYFTYVCDSERNATEDREFTCYIKARDTDELNSLTFSSNTTWFLNTTTNTTLVGYNASILVNFTPTDIEVGNWSINITVRDTENNPSRQNSTVIRFFVNNTHDPVSISNISSITTYSGNSYSIQVNATDDDLLIPDKSVYRENLTFSANVSWINFTTQSISGNLTMGLMHFTLTQELISNHTINITVNDSSGNSDSTLFSIFVYNNTAPQWNSSLDLAYNLTEHQEFYLNLSQYVYDAESDAITFNFTNLTYFPSFNFTNGIINFTPDDIDVGFHRVRINASDNKTEISIILNFSLSNTNDIPFFPNIQNWNASEDSLFRNTTYICDNDFLITNKSIYNETFIPSLIIQGQNSTLFRLVFNSIVRNCSGYNISFTPDYRDMGYYNITINVTDSSNGNNFTTFNLTVNGVNDAPVIMGLTNYTTGVNKTFTLVINVIDEEDGNNAGGNLTLAIFNISDSSKPLFFTINSITGLINLSSINSTHAGSYHLNVSVNDTGLNGVGNITSSTAFWIFIYDVPVLTALSPPNFYSLINSAENSTLSPSISASDGVDNQGRNLTAYWYIDNVSKNTSVADAYGEVLAFYYTLNFTEETTCSGNKTLLVNVSNPEYSSSTWWNLSVNHTNYPVAFHTTIPDQSSGSPLTLNLDNYFRDVDYNDVCNNQTVTFNYTRMDSNLSVLPSGSIGVSFSGWNIIFSSSSDVREYFRVNLSDANSSVESNNFSVRVYPPTTQQSTSGGGGGSSATKPVSLKIIMPEPISVYKKDIVILPIKLVNDGKVKLNTINLISSVFKEQNQIKTGVEAQLSKTYFESLSPGGVEKIDLSLIINTEEVGEYEININATVQEPKYTDWGKMYLSIKETNKSEAEKMILFTEELIVSNPECLELKELLSEAKKAVERKNYDEAFNKARDAVESCKSAINQRGRLSAIEKPKSRFPTYVKVIIAVVIFYILALVTYKIVMKRKV